MTQMIRMVGDVVVYVSVIIGALVVAHTCCKINGYIDWRMHTHVKDKKDGLSEKEWHAFETVLEVFDDDTDTIEFSNLMEEDTEE
jgi:hypothetical protein